jgi:hypothetical protein
VLFRDEFVAEPFLAVDVSCIASGRMKCNRSMANASDSRILDIIKSVFS